MIPLGRLPLMNQNLKTYIFQQVPVIRDCFTKLDFEKNYEIRKPDLGMVLNNNKEILEFSTNKINDFA